MAKKSKKSASVEETKTPEQETTEAPPETAPEPAAETSAEGDDLSDGELAALESLTSEEPAPETETPDEPEGGAESDPPPPPEEEPEEPEAPPAPAKRYRALSRLSSPLAAPGDLLELGDKAAAHYLAQGAIEPC